MTPRSRRKAILATVQFGLMIASGCRGGVPSTSEVRRAVLEPILRGNGGDFVVVEDFRKVNGLRDTNGAYVAECRYVVLFRVSAREIVSAASVEAGRLVRGGVEDLGRGRLLGLDAAVQAVGIPVAGLGVQLLLGDFEAGHRITVEKSVRLEETEEGLRVSREFEREMERLDSFPVSRILASGLLTE